MPVYLYMCVCVFFVEIVTKCEISKEEKYEENKREKKTEEIDVSIR